MVKRTIVFSNPAYLHTKQNQLVISAAEQNDKTIPIEDIGIVLCDHDQIRITKTLLAKLLENNAAVVITDGKHLPAGLFLPLDANILQQERFTEQVGAPVPVRKQLWKQTILAKIRNQALVLKKFGMENAPLSALLQKVRSGDPGNIEAVAAQRYWKLLFSGQQFRRRRCGDPPNNLLNYGYAVLRALLARSLIGGGLLPLIGIHHRNRYNAFPLADDIMEPYRPFVDSIVYELSTQQAVEDLTPESKKALLGIPAVTVTMGGEQSPLMVAASRTASSLQKCFHNQSSSLLAFPQP